MGSLSAGVGMGSAGTGAICWPGPVLGRPTAQNGTSSSLGGAGAAGCCPRAGVGTTASRARVKASDEPSRVIEDAVIAPPPCAGEPAVNCPLPGGELGHDLRAEPGELLEH